MILLIQYDLTQDQVRHEELHHLPEYIPNIEELYVSS